MKGNLQSELIRALDKMLKILRTYKLEETDHGITYEDKVILADNTKFTITIPREKQ